MPRTVTITFDDGSSHIYNGVPDAATPDQVIARAKTDFSGKQISNIDGGRQPTQPTFPQQLKTWSSGEPGTQYGEILPVARTKSGSMEFAAPQIVRSTVSGIADLLSGAHGELPYGQNLSPEATTALMALSPAGDVRLAEPAANVAARAATSVSKSVGTGIAKVGGLAAKAGKIIPNAIGKESALARTGVQSEATEGVSNLIREGQTKLAANKALTDTVAGRPEANVLEVQKSDIPSGAKLSQARANVRTIDHKLSEATTKLQTAQRTLSSLDKYAGPQRSEYMIRSARKNLNMAQKEVNRLTEEKTNAVNDLNEATQEHHAQMAEAKKTGSYQQSSPEKIATQANKAKSQIDNLSILRAKINAKDATPGQIADAAKQIGEKLLKSNHLTETQYQDYLGRVNTMVAKAKSTSEARRQLIILLRGAAMIGGGFGVGTGILYEMRRMF